MKVNFLVHKGITLFLIIFWFSLPLGFVHAQVTTISPELPEFVQGEILVKLKPSYSLSTLQPINRIIGVSAIKNLAIERWYKLKIPIELDIPETVEKYKQLPSIEYATPNYRAYLHIIPNDQYFSRQWALYQPNDRDIDADLAWNIEQGSSTIKIGIIDTGVDPNHPDLVDNLLTGYDFVDIDPDALEWWEYPVGDYLVRDNDPSDDFGHGTHVSGIAGARGNNNRGIAGVSWYSKILPIRAFYSYYDLRYEFIIHRQR